MPPSQSGRWIRQFANRAALAKGFLIRDSVGRYDTRRKIERVRKRHVTRFGSEPSINELARETELTAAQVERALPKMVFNSLSAPVDDQGAEFGDVLPSDRLSSDEPLDKKETTLQVRDLLERLPERERIVLRHRFEIDDADHMMLEALGDDLAISRERVRQVQNDALEKLRRTAVRQGLSA